MQYVIASRITIVVFQDLKIDQAIQRQINDQLRARGKPFYPVLCVPLHWFGCNCLQDGVQHGVARLCPVREEQGFLIRVNARSERKHRDYGTDDSTAQIPAWNLVEIAALLVEEHQDEFLGQG